MKTEQRGQMTSYIDQILDSTKLNKINWSNANPTTYVWDNTKNSGRLIVQQLGATPFFNADKKIGLRKNYLMQILDENGVQQLEIQGQFDQEFNAKLQALFEEIEYIKTQKALNFLGSILPQND